MHALSDAELLSVWERGLGQGAVQRALILLAAACPETPADELSRWSIGQRDAELLQFRAQTFGSRLISVANCPACGQDAELELETSQLLTAPVGPPPAHLELEVNDYRVRFRLPNSTDLLAAERVAKVDDARDELLARCLIWAEVNGVALAASDLPAEIATAIAERMAEADPLADVRLSGECPACGASWLAPFDIVSFFWTELSAWARRQVREVHLLASAYGWREAEILALGATRRGLYLELIE